ncbi:hypothetical protein AMTR_s00057p00078460 [Amborella trichopoda]|uniref:Uncharacterized protein n=1 Tax=Amborella trichopoda TaxID=13333 RepID=U5D2X5_AMBTC|nr:hypothetical protein AMTR_s00057p00078460 [Amborella trichopoda]
MEGEEYQSCIALPRIEDSASISELKLVGWGERVCLIRGLQLGKLTIWRLSQEKKWEMEIRVRLRVTSDFTITDISRMQIVMHNHCLIIAHVKRFAEPLAEFSLFDLRIGKLKWCYASECDSFFNLLPVIQTSPADDQFPHIHNIVAEQLHQESWWLFRLFKNKVKKVTPLKFIG